MAPKNKKHSNRQSKKNYGSKEEAEEPKTQEEEKEPTNESIRYLKRLQVVKTDIRDPLQGQVICPEDLSSFITDLEGSSLTKIIGIYLDEDNMSVGYESLASGQKPSEFNTAVLFHYYVALCAAQFIVIVNHPNGDAAPTDDDRKLVGLLQVQAQVMRANFHDYVIVGCNGTYWSMRLHKGTACHCGRQEYIKNAPPV